MNSRRGKGYLREPRTAGVGRVKRGNHGHQAWKGLKERAIDSRREKG